MGQVPPLEDTGSQVVVSETSSQESAAVLGFLAEGVIYANTSLEKTRATQMVGTSGESTANIYQAGTAGMTPAIRGIANLSLDSPRDTGVRGSQKCNIQPPVNDSDNSGESNDED